MKKVRVLIADDDAHILRFLSDLLSNDFCVVGTVSDERALVAAAVELHPHIIITDIDISTMNGLDAVRRLQTLMPGIKVIFLSTHTEPEYVSAAFAAGASAFLSKVGSRNLLGRLRAVIRDLHTAPPNEYAGQAFVRQDDRMPIEKGAA